jgi:hypothetical protein
MQADEVGTLEALKAHRRALVDRTIAGHRGPLRWRRRRPSA